MSITCNHCEGTGFVNLQQIKDTVLTKAENSPNFCEFIQKWIEDHERHDVAVCGCCGNGEGWYGTPGEHYNSEDPGGYRGPYEYNGGLCECD